MAGHILHIGRDTCHRLPVFASAGYTVESCASMAVLRDALYEGASDAVVMTEIEGVSLREAVRLARACSPVPLVLFRETQHTYGEDGLDLEKDFDLVIPILHPPSAWLADIAALIEKSRKVRTGPAEAAMRSEAARAGAKSVLPCPVEDCAGNAASRERPTRDPKPGKGNL